MSTCTGGCVRNVINLGNSIIGVSILAMPYCFQKCGILLSLLLILASGLLTRASCHLLLKAAIIARRRNFEFLAFHTFGSTGKFAVEVGIIGFLLGSCVAFFVVIGDLGPPLVAELFLMKNHPHLRVELLLFLGFMVGLPLGLLRKVDSLTSFSALSVCFYLCLMLKIFSEAFPNLASDLLWPNIIWWRPEGIMSALPIFAMALSCQTQLFEIFDTLNEPSLKRMDAVVSGAVHMCTVVYSTVGLFGYVAFFNTGISGNVLLSLPATALSKFVKLGFIFTVVISFPLCLFPCRTSLHSLLYRPGVGHHDHPSNIIPDHRFRCLTTALVAITVGTSIMLPNIELVLGIVGSTIGATICFILPALVFIRITTKNTNERLVAQIILSIGVFILVACTYATLRDANQPATVPPITSTTVDLKKSSKQIVATPEPYVEQKVNRVVTDKALVTIKPSVVPVNVVEKKASIVKEKEVLGNGEEKRQEPPVPQEPEETKQMIPAISENKPPDQKAPEQENNLDPDALKKEDKEMEGQKERKPVDVASKQSDKKDANVQRQDELIKKLEEQQMEQKKLIEEQKKLLEELRHHKESHDPKQEGLPVKDEQPRVQPIVHQNHGPKIDQQDVKVNHVQQEQKHQSNVQLPPKTNLQQNQMIETDSNVHGNNLAVPKHPDISKVKQTVNHNPSHNQKEKLPQNVPLPPFLPQVNPIPPIPNPQNPVFRPIEEIRKQESIPEKHPMETIKNPLLAQPIPVASRQQQIAASDLVNSYITGNKGTNVSKVKDSPVAVQETALNRNNEMRKLLQDDLREKTVQGNKTNIDTIANS